MDWNLWISENGCGTKNVSVNGIDYKFVMLKDGWVAIFENNYPYGLIPVIQAADENKAMTYVTMRERPSVPLQVIC